MRWLDSHGPSLLLLARQYGCGAHEAEDAVQAGFIRFWQKRETALDPVAFLFGCVKHAAQELLRSERRLKMREEAIAKTRGQDELPAFTVQAEKNERQEELQRGLGKLPVEQREVVTLKIWGELTFAQIGQVLQISPDTAASRYRYALKTLRAAISAEALR